MTPFWLVGAALVAVALGFLLKPLLWQRSKSAVSRRDANVSIYRDQLRELDADLAGGTLAQADYDRTRREIEARVLEDATAAPQAAPARTSRVLALVLGIALPLAALGLYVLVGSPGALYLEAEHQANARQLEAMLERLAARLRERPDDAEGWKLLGRSQSVLGRHDEAAAAYARAAVLQPRDAQVLADLADALAMSRGQRGEMTLQGEPEKLVLRALELDAQNLKALALAGTAAFERKDFAAAVRYWQRMLPLVAPGSEDARSIQASIEEAKSLAKPGAAAATLKGTVRLSPELKAKVSPDDTVFIFARAAQGPPMPLAVKRAKVRELPLAFALDDSMAMAPGMTLSAHPRVVIGARVSKSGQATPQPGDLQGASAPVANDAANVIVVIDSVVK
jgi:cytochrome c-type biogenesis protein CcmH